MTISEKKKENRSFNERTIAFCVLKVACHLLFEMRKKWWLLIINRLTRINDTKRWLCKNCFFLHFSYKKVRQVCSKRRYVSHYVAWRKKSSIFHRNWKFDCVLVSCILNESTEKRIKLLQCEFCSCAHRCSEHTQSLWSAASFIHFKWYIVKYLLDLLLTTI